MAECSLKCMIFSSITLLWTRAAHNAGALFAHEAVRDKANEREQSNERCSKTAFALQSCRLLQCCVCVLLSRLVQLLDKQAALI